ncbi:hypothetical protein C9374_012428 [Naegleria lovaniensis]|uniref:Uncharacterized protein n=1 Tax=Naegleria lovaniensis TaxID=51637 RepID=A0AA88H118_NAELO|nr:uncharacterized protein C9374_012428 [Naegleria lovaniensis]KAG2392176.1 hypothetical protein C9374_012428 [Naegleria lovaniensis]
MFNFHKYALTTTPSSMVESTNGDHHHHNCYQQLNAAFGDMFLILKTEFRNNQWMSLVQRVNIYALHKHAYKLYDERNKPTNPPLLSSTSGWVPVSYLTTITPDPLKCMPNKSLDLSRALVDNEEEIEQAENYQKEHGIRMDNYETYCRDVYEFECFENDGKRMVKRSPHQCHVHCLEASKFDEFNITLEEFERNSEEWKKKAREQYPEARDLFFVKNSKHPGYLHGLVKSAYISETIVNALNAFSDRPCLGFRRKITHNDFENRHRFYTFAQLYERVMRFGVGMFNNYDNEKLIKQPRPFSEEEGRGFVGICSGNRPDFFVADWACLTQSFVSIALPKAKVDCLSEDIVNMESVDVMKSACHEIISIVNNSQIPLIVCSRELSVKFLKLIKNGLLPSVQAIIQMDDFLIEDGFDSAAYWKAYQDHSLEDYLQMLRLNYQTNLKELTKKFTTFKQDTTTPYYYLMKSRYPDSNWNMHVSIEDLCDWNLKDEDFVLLNYISENDFNLDCKARILAKELSIELKDMISIELSTFNEYPSFSDSLRFNVRTNKNVNDLCTIIYTSGSTSAEPKGAVLSDKHYNENVTMSIFHYHPLVFISYAPLSHMTDRVNTTACMINGGRTGFYCGDMDRVFEDYQSVQPVTDSNTPRFYNILYSEYQRLRNQLGEGPISQEQESIYQQIRNMLGGRIKSLVTGGASTSPQVIQFLKDCFKCPVFNGYSSTECGFIGSLGVNGVDYLNEKIQEENKKLPRHVMLLDGVEIKLESVPELGYFITDQPHARGEICVKSGTIIKNYYRDSEKTKTAFDSENYFQTGDIGEIDKEKLSLRVIDRKKNIFKLSQGEFVAPENLENLFISKSMFVDQIFLYGNSEKSFLVAVVVPKNLHLLKEMAMNRLHETNSSVDVLDLSRNGVMYHIIQDDINKVAREAKIESYEIPKAFIIELEKFTPENGKMTASDKLCRPALVKFYKQALEELYLQFERADFSNMNNISTKEELQQFLHELFKSGGIVDSLSSIRLSNILSQKFNVNIRADRILQECKSHENPASKLMELIEKYRNNEDGEQIFTSLQEIEQEIDTLVKAIPKISNEQYWDLTQPECILLTGATGFIGVGIWCEQLLENNISSIYCIVRGRSVEEEKHRVFENIRHYCYHLQAEPLETLKQQFEKRVHLLLGDISLANFGLDDTTYETLSRKVDSIIHCAATVNFVMNYSQLKPTNVHSVVECLKLCTREKIKPLHFVSTISVIPSSILDQHKEHETLVPEDFIPLSFNVFNELSEGYPQSKYIAEHVLNHVIQEKNFRWIKIYRPGLVVGHSMNGFCNVREWICRLTCGFVHLEAIPYEYSEGGIQVIPVDTCAKCIVKIANNGRNSRDHYERFII